MIKFFQKLKAKKGFTLVELIVVIAIIGVLAAILIPTMLGYVTSSRVTSANTTAASIKNNIDAFLTQADTAGYGMKLGSTNEVLQIYATGGEWHVKGATAASFKKSDAGEWGKATDSSTAAGAIATSNAEEFLAYKLKGLFPEVDNCVISASLVGGKCVGVIYIADVDSPAFADLGASAQVGIPDWNATTHELPATFGWDGTTAGIANASNTTYGGLIVGTAPAVQLGA